MRLLSENIKMSSAIKILIGSALLLLASCTPSDELSPGVEYMPDMYRSPSYETYSVSNLDGDSINEMSARLPVKGTVPRGYYPYSYPNTTEGYELAGEELTSPFAMNAETVEEGKVIYGKFCIHCHGETGEGDGSVIASGKFPAVPPTYSGKLKDLPEGKIFHSITYGKGMMGSHASQLDRNQRWKIIHYVKTLQNPDLEVAAVEIDTTTVDVEVAEIIEEVIEEEVEESHKH
ncbi:MAG: cytochrome c [Flavobacteriales bacterium]|nr:cytochrome c [Flavobacteriales bacterium]